jgi:DNA gyrase/topoisomerase IV subunit A
VIEKESRALQKQFGTPRRTQLEKEKDGEVSDEDVIANQECILVSIRAGVLLLSEQVLTQKGWNLLNIVGSSIAAALTSRTGV